MLFINKKKIQTSHSVHSLFSVKLHGSCVHKRKGALKCSSGVSQNRYS